MSAAMTIKIRPGGQDVLRQIDESDRVIRRGVRQGWFNVGREWKAATSREILRRPKAGRIYLVRGPSGRRRRHVASAPGETHANLTGATRRSLSWLAHGHTELTVGYGVSSTGRNAPTKHGPALEFGTRNMDPRPSILNGIEAVKGNAARHLEDGVTRELAR